MKNMKNNKFNLHSICCAAALFAVLTTGCGSTNTETAETESDTTTEKVTTESSTLSADTLSDESAEYYITFDENGVSTNLEDASVNGTIITISAPCDNVDVTGKCSDGQIVVDVDKTKYTEGSVTLNLKGIELSNSSDSPVYVASVPDKCEICVKKDFENTLTDGESYTNQDGESAVIYSKDDLKISGKGTLTVNGKADGGIVCKDDLKIYNGNITVNSVGTGIKGKDSVVIGDEENIDNSNPVLNVTTADGDGIKSTNSEEEGKGTVTINCGDITVNSTGDGIQSETDFTINGGTININAEGESDDSDDTSDNSSTASASNVSNLANFGGGMNEPSLQTNGNKGIKAGGSLVINDGDITVSSSGHSVHASAESQINGGNITISSENGKAISIHGNLTIGTDTTSPTITINKATEAVESKAVLTINNGSVIINYASDDGLNTGGTESDDHTLNINGGYVYIDMTEMGDGVDSNGNIYFNGGVTIVNGPTGGGDSSVDAESGVYYNGGTVLAAGSADMLGGDCQQADGSTNSNLYSSSLGATNGTDITITDSNGNVIAHYTLNDSNSSDDTVHNGFVFSSDSITSDGEYHIYTGGTYTGGTKVGDNGFYTGGTFSSDSATEVTQSTAQGGFGGGGNMGGGGMQQPGGMGGGGMQQPGGNMNF